MPVASKSNNNLPTQIQVDFSNPLNLGIVEEELAKLARVEFSPYQQWVCATALAYLVKEHSDVSYVQTRSAAAGVRDLSEDLFVLMDELHTEDSRPHMLADGVGTNAFTVLGNKSFLKHEFNFYWKLTPKFKGLVSRLQTLVAEAEAEVSEEVESDRVAPASLGVDPLEGLSVRYTASGHTVPRELFKELEEQGVRGLALKFEYQGSEITPDRFLLSLLDSRS